METKKFEIKKGQKLIVHNHNFSHTWEAGEDCAIEVAGNWGEPVRMIDSKTGAILIEKPAAVRDYAVTADCINAPSQWSETTIDGKPTRVANITTDIGGCYLQIDNKDVCLLHNGYGDGRYRLKVSGNTLFR